MGVHLLSFTTSFLSCHFKLPALAALRVARAPPRDLVPRPVQSGMLLAGDVSGTMPEQIHPLVDLCDPLFWLFTLTNRDLE